MIIKQTTLDLNGPILSFIQQPQSVTINNNGSTQFTGIATATFPQQSPPNPATGTGTISYRWYESSFGILSDGVNSTLGATISGSSTPTLSISNSTKTNLRFYVVVDYIPSAYSQPSGSTITVGTARSTGNATNEPNSSNIATLTVRPLISVTQNPSSASVAVNTRANFSALGSSNDGTAVSYRWQLNGSDIFDSGNISGSGTPNLSVSLSNPSNNTVRARISHPTASNSPIFTNSANFTVSRPRAIINIEDFAGESARFFRSVDLSSGSYIFYGSSNPGSVHTVYSPERNIRVRITLAAGAGEDRNGYFGGQGGVSVFDYTLEQNVQYVFKAANRTSDRTNGPLGGGPNGAGVSQLYRKARLVAMCGGGGGAGIAGNGGAGGGVSLAGQAGSGRNAGVGGRYVAPGTVLNGSFASRTIGGFVSTCMRGDNLIALLGIPACNDFPGLTQSVDQFNNPIPGSAFIIRGFKVGSPAGYRSNGGNGTLNDGGGGSGAYGGNAGSGNSGGGGGGGSGYTDGSIALISSIIGGNNLKEGYISIQIAE
jgi:hypothetical protein